MCGLVGYLGDTTVAINRAFLDLLYLDVVRGKDGTGVLIVTNQGVIWSDKTASTPYDLEVYSELKMKLNNRTNIIYMGHNRAATRGDISDKNAHPFQHGKIIGMHNGTLINASLIPDYSKFDTDSEAIVHCISKIGIKDTYSKLHGAAALAFYDAKAKEMNLITDGSRPLFFGFLKNNRGVFYASEDWMIKAVCQRHGIVLDVTIKPKDDILFKFSYHNCKLKVSEMKLEKYVVPVVILPHHDKSYWQDDGWVITGKKVFNKAFNLLEYNKDKHKVKEKLVGSMWRNFCEGPGNISRGEFKQVGQCCFCGEPVDFDDAKVMIYDKYTLQCGECDEVYSSILHGKLSYSNEKFNIH